MPRHEHLQYMIITKLHVHDMREVIENECNNSAEAEG
jgi:hypothetical protein